MITYKSNILKNLKKIRENGKINHILEGKLTRVVGLTLEAIGCREAIGSRVLVSIGHKAQVEAEVVGFEHDKSYLMCIGSTQGIAPGARIIPTNKVAQVGVSEFLLGRVIDGAGKPLDGKGPIKTRTSYSLHSEPFNPLLRSKIHEPLDVGVRSINSLLSIGKGQRIGLFAGSGVGKSVLLSMITKYTTADVIIVGLIGERGREVKEFIEGNLGDDGLKRAVIVASPADESPLMRLHGAMLSASIAEYFRDQGQQVLLLMDSLTRFAQAQREIGLSIGEPPTTKGYPPSVFTKLPQLVERAGNGIEGGGSITAIYTVLTEGDDQQDPIADASRAILDGHIVLSRKLAEAGQFPAVDVEASISRVMDSIISDEHKQYAREFKHLMSVYSKNKDLISVGAYVAGNNAILDKAVQLNELLMAFLRQDTNELVDFENAVSQLVQIFSNGS